MELPKLPPVTGYRSITVYKNKVRSWHNNLNNINLVECYQLDPFAASFKWENCAEVPRLKYPSLRIQVGDDMWLFADRRIHVVHQTGTVKNIEWPHEGLGNNSCVTTNSISTIVIPNESKHVYINSDATSPQSWELLATLPTSLLFRACLLMGTSLYVTGGRNVRTTSKESYVIDIENGNVKRLGDMLEAHNDHAMGVIEGAPAVISGYHQSTVEILNIATGRWGPTSPRPPGVHYIAVYHPPITFLARSVSFAIN